MFRAVYIFYRNNHLNQFNSMNKSGHAWPSGISLDLMNPLLPEVYCYSLSGIGMLANGVVRPDCNGTTERVSSDFFDNPGGIRLNVKQH